MDIFKKDSFYLILGWVLTILSVILLYQQGLARSYFFQDDVVELGVVADWKGWPTLIHQNNEHLNITFWPILRLQWLLFGINYAPYLALNVLFHIITLFLIFIITYKITKSFIWSSVGVWAMVINSNWFSVIWWITGQMFLSATIFALLTYWVILKIKDNPKLNYLYGALFLFSVLPGLSWGVGLAWPIWPLLIFGIDYSKKRFNKIGYVLIASQITLAIIYFSLIGNNLGVHSDPKIWLSNPIAIINFIYVGIRNTLIGRWLWPEESLKIRAICIIATFLIFLISKPFKKIDRNIIFGLLVAFGSFATFAVPRWRFGIIQAMANYYAYFPLAFLLISVAIFLNKMKLKGLKKIIILAVFILHIPMSWLGFEDWASEWVKKPQQTKIYFQELSAILPGDCIENKFIPKFIVPENKWRIDYLWPIFKKDFNPFCNKKSE